MKSLDRIEQSSILNAFKHCGINNSLDGKEDNLLLLLFEGQPHYKD